MKLCRLSRFLNNLDQALYSNGLGGFRVYLICLVGSGISAFIIVLYVINAINGETRFAIQRDIKSQLELGVGSLKGGKPSTTELCRAPLKSVTNTVLIVQMPIQNFLELSAHPLNSPNYFERSGITVTPCREFTRIEAGFSASTSIRTELTEMGYRVECVKNCQMRGLFL